MFRTVMICVLAVAILTPTSLMAQEQSEMLDPRPYDPATEPEIDMFISSWKESSPRLEHGGWIVRDIFTPLEGDDPLRPAKHGAVLTDFKGFYHALIYSGISTTPSTLVGEQKVVYVHEGEGTITGGGKTFTLSDGCGVIIPPGLEFVMTCTSDEPLGMYVVVEPIPSGFMPNEEIVFIDTADRPFHTTTGHWVHESKRLFYREDGLAIMVGLGPVWFDPMTMGQPHSHGPGVEEIWFALSENVDILLGKQLRHLPPGTAYRIPSDDATPHSTINLTDEPILVFWIMKTPR